MSYDDWKFGFYDEEPEEPWKKDYIHVDELPPVETWCDILEAMVDNLYVNEEIDRKDLEESFNKLLKEMGSRERVPKEKVRL